MANKVLYGLQDVHFATFSVAAGAIAYDTPVAMPGGVELSLEPRGEMAEFYADNVLYFSAANNQGYDGTLSIATIPEEFLVQVMGEVKDSTDMVITENVRQKTKPFALLYQIEGDVKASRRVLYNCTANRPTVGSATTTDSVEPSPNELTFVASGDEVNGDVKTKTLADTTSTVYDGWFDAVYQKV